MHQAYQALLQWLLRGGLTLEDTLSAMDTLRAMLARWQYNMAAQGTKLSDALLQLQRQASEDSAAIRWGWACENGRRAMLTAMLADCHPGLSCTEAETALLVRGGRSIVLVKLLADYGLCEAQLTERATQNGAASPEALEKEMRAIIARHSGEQDELFYAACLRLHHTAYTGTDGRQHTAIGDFLTTWLMQKELKTRTIPPEEGGDGL